MSSIKTSKNIKLLAFPLFSLITLSILFYFVFKYGYGRYLFFKTKLLELKKADNVFKQKEQVLRLVTQQISASSDVSLAAIPDHNPSLEIISSLKALAQQKGIILENLKVGSSSQKDTLSSVSITLESNTASAQVVDFLKSIRTITPLTLVNSLKFENTKDVIRVNVGLMSFWAPLPLNISAISEPILDLTAEEKDLLQKVSILTPSQFSNIVPTTPDSSRESPF